MKKIIVPVDFSPCSIKAVLYASELARLMNTAISVLYVHKAGASVDSMPQQTYKSNMPLSKVIHTQMNMIKNLLEKAGVKEMEFFVKEGSLNEEIMRLAEDEDADLVVMGTERLTYAYDLIWGTRTSNLISKMKIPVLVIPEGATAHLNKNPEFVLATDFEGIEFIPEFYISLAKKLQATINVFYVKSNNEDKEQLAFERKRFDDLRNYFEGLTVNLHKASLEGVVEATNDFVRAKNASLVTMISQHKGFLDGFLHTSVTQEMALETEIPFLAVPEKKMEKNQTIGSYW